MGIKRGSVKPDFFIEDLCLVRQSMNSHTSNTNGVGRLDDSHACITNQRTTNPLAIQR